MVTTENPRKRTLKDKFANFVYKREHRVFDKKQSAGTVLNKKKTIFFILAMLAIPVANWIVFWFVINIQSIALAFQDPRTGVFTWDNFKWFWENLTSENGAILVALKNTLMYFSATVFIVLPLSLVIAYFLYKKIAGHKVFRIIFYLPAIISGTALVTAYLDLISCGNLWDMFIHLFGKSVPQRGYLVETGSANTVILFYTIFTSFTSNVLLFSGAMARVPTDVLESARLEGCSPFRELIEIIFPLIWPTFATQLVFTMTGIFTASGPILLFRPQTDGCDTLSYWIFKMVYDENAAMAGSAAYNLVSATGLFFTLVGMPIILGVRKLTDKIDAVEY